MDWTGVAKGVVIVFVCARVATYTANYVILNPMGIRENINLHLLPATSTVYLIVRLLRYAPIKRSPDMFYSHFRSYIPTLIRYIYFFHLLNGSL